MSIVKIFLISTLLAVLPLFVSRVETIKNLLIFVCLVFLVAVNVGLFYGISYFPIFVLLTYIGAVVVSTLLVLLTFDLRKEYSKTKYHKNFLSAIVSYFLATPFLFLIVNSLSFSSEKVLVRSSIDFTELYMKCIGNSSYSEKFCDEELRFVFRDHGLYSTFQQSTNDLYLVSTNFYDSHSLLFITLSILLSMALVAALTIIKKH